MAARRQFDVVVWGATGFTGHLVAKYLANAPGARNLKWAIAGRNESRLNAIKEELVGINSECSKVGILLGDSSSQESLDAIAKQTKVIICMTGPYALYAPGVVDACVRFGTDYLDLTAESPWVKQNIDRYHEDAKAKKTFILHSVGFDSIPADLGAYMMAKYVQETYGKDVSTVSSYVSLRGGASGGTAASGIDIVEKGGQSAMANPFFLAGPNRPKLPRVMPKLIGYSKDIKKWFAPFFMTPANQQVVYRTNALVANQTEATDKYSTNFYYKEVMAVPTMIHAAIITFVMAMAVFFVQFAPVRSIAKKFLPPPGTGPSADKRAKSFFRYELVADVVDPEPGKPAKVFGQISGGDPGYDESAKLIAEAALGLIHDRTKMRTQGGVVTPAFAFGKVLIERLKAAGIKIGTADSYAALREALGQRK
eukprot:GILK01003801.1.p1 GENE.GILK01003801.1~~GILK01003801.1.p1  ORF type:complete len:424 (+),score=78.99 GILK01003801.1:109-1380(+)